MEETTTSPRARVARGAEMLDRIYGGRSVWARAIDRQTLNMASASDCVLGQLLGEYGHAVRVMFGGSYVESQLLGFDVHPDVRRATGDGAREITALRREWAEIVTRAAQVGPAQFELWSTWVADPDRIAGSEGSEFFHSSALARLADLRAADPDMTHVYAVRLVGPVTPDVLYNPHNGG